jgi:hypothetical protein
MIKKALLICGIIVSALYFSMDIIASLLYPGYIYSDQAISELSAIGAPTQTFWIIMTFFYCPILIAFGIGVRLAAGNKRTTQITGILLSIWGLLGYVWLFFPMHMRGAIGSATDTGHLVMSGLTVALIVLFLGFGSNTDGKWFRIYSIVTILLTLIFGAGVGTQAPMIAAQQPTPGMGIMERISVFSPMVWMIVLAAVLLRSQSTVSKQ